MKRIAENPLQGPDPTDGLAFVVDPEGNCVRVAGERRKFLGMAILPDDGPKLKEKGWDAGYGLGVVFSATPTTCPRLLISTGMPLLPPSVGNAVSTPLCPKTNGRHTRLVPKKRKVFSVRSGVEVSEKPVTASLSLIPRANVALFGPPRVPRSVNTPLCQRSA